MKTNIIQSKGSNDKYLLTDKIMVKKSILLIILLVCCSTWSQQTIFSENMGNPSTTTSITSNTFANSGSLTYSTGSQTNSADVRITSPSSGYSNASGSGNVYFSSTSGAYGFSIEGINASNYSSITLDYGYKKESASVFASFSVEYWNGSAWGVLANTSTALFNEASNASAIWYSAKTLSLPNDAQINGLKIRFVKTGSTAIRIDDVKLNGVLQTTPTVINSSVSAISSTSATFGGNVTDTGGATITATGTTYALTTVNSNPILGGTGVSSITSASPNSGTGTFSNNSGSLFLPNVQYSYNAFATKTGGATGYGTTASFYTLATDPTAPVVSNPTWNSITVAIGSDTNSSITTYAILEVNSGNYVQSSGVLGATAFFQTATNWGNKIVTGLTPLTTYSFKVIARNGAGVDTNTSASTSGTTLITPSVASDIIFNSSSSTSQNENLNYVQYQSDEISNSTNGVGGSIGVMGFYLRDGGSGLNDADNLSTELTSITFNVSNISNIRSAKLFVGNAPKGDTYHVANNDTAITFSGLTGIVANDNSQLAVNLRVTFKDQVTDNQQMQFTVTSVTAKAGGSSFTLNNGGGATSAISGNINRIEVTADRLIYDVQPTSTGIGIVMNPSPRLIAKDILGNKDLDYSGLVSMTSTGTLSSSPQTANAVAGVVTFNNIVHINADTGIILTASASGLNGVSSNTSFSINTLIVPTFNQVTPICMGATLNSLPTTSTNGAHGSWSPQLNNSETTTYTFTPDNPSVYTTATMQIVVNPNTIVPAFTQIPPINSGGSFTLPLTSNDGYTGSWLPTINNTISTVYTFTPNIGYCATNATMTVVVLSNNTSNNVATGSENYIKTTTYKEENSNNPIENITYFDGLGRPIQKIEGKQTPAGKDLITHIEYDASGRQEKDYLPYISTQNNLSYIASSTIVPNLITQYQNIYGDNNPFSQKLFDHSPLNRISKQAAPGNDWALNSGHEIQFEYKINATNEVKMFSAFSDFMTNTVTLNNNSGSVFYNPGELFRTITHDENNNLTEEFKNKEGKIIMKRAYGTSVVDGVDSTVWHETYYVFDQYGNLCFIIPPSVTNVSTQLNDLCYQYKYDYRNRLIEKKLPGKQWEFMVYDKLDRLVATGPVASPFINLTADGWLITKYDAFNRIIYTGWENISATSVTRANKQSAQNGLSIINENRQNSGNIDGTIVYYSNNVVPTDFKLLTVNYYDDYNFPNAPTNFANVEGQAIYNNTGVNIPKTLKTGKWVRVLLTDIDNIGDSTYFLYDLKGKTVVTNTINYSGGFSETINNLEKITGRLNYKITRTSLNSNSQTILLRENFNYDSQDRLLVQTHQINGGTVNLIDKKEYNELGQLISKRVGGTDILNYNGLQKVDYNYNIRGWTTGINDDIPTQLLSLNTSENDLFAYRVNYNKVENQTAYTGTKLYNSNIAETHWITANDNKLKKYGYFYDEFNRMKNAVYLQPNDAISEPGFYNESLSYDKNGNILKLQRNGDNNISLPALPIDDLTFTYANNNSSNQLKSIQESFNGNPASGFIDGANNTDEYGYDAYGNMTRDDNKRIANIKYNHLNLPTKITFATTGIIEYIYDAEGKKREKKVTETGLNLLSTKYFEGFQYTDDGFILFPHTEGYIGKNSTTYTYVYNYTDLFGNIRLSYADMDKDGIVELNEHVIECHDGYCDDYFMNGILKENNYYPFGLEHRGYNENNGQPVDYKYKFQGQERQDELGLNWDSFKWRNYDPAIGRFMSIDPLSEKYPYNSIYAFQENKMGMGRELEGLELDQFNKYASEFGHAVTGLLDSFEAAFSFGSEETIVPGVVTVETSNTTTYSGNFTNYAMSSQYPNYGSANLFSKKTEVKTEVKTTAKATVVVEGVTVTVSNTQSKNVTTGDRENQSKAVVGVLSNGVFVSRTSKNGGKSQTRAGVQVEASTKVTRTTKFSVSASLSIGK